MRTLIYKMHRIWGVLWAFLLVCLASQTSASESTLEKASNKKPLVMVSIRPLALIVDELAGSSVDTQVLVDSAASPHDFSLTIGQALALNDADLLVWNGPEFEQFLSKGVRTKHKIALHDLIHLEQDKNNAHDHSERSIHGWLSLTSVDLLAKALAKQLIGMLPAEEATINSRLVAFSEKLTALKKNTDQQLSSSKNIPFAVYHDAYGEFVDTYGLKQIAKLTSSSHEQLSARRLVAFGNATSDAACLLAEVAEERQARRYANMYELNLVLVDLLAVRGGVDSFEQYYRAVAGAFGECFGLNNALYHNVRNP